MLSQSGYCGMSAAGECEVSGKYQDLLVAFLKSQSQSVWYRAPSAKLQRQSIERRAPVVKLLRPPTRHRMLSMKCRCQAVHAGCYVPMVKLWRGLLAF